MVVLVKKDKFVTFGKATYYNKKCLGFLIFRKERFNVTNRLRLGLKYLYFTGAVKASSVFICKV